MSVKLSKDELDAIVYDLAKHDIFAHDEISFRSDRCLELRNKKDGKSFTATQIELIKKHSGFYNVNMDLWLLPFAGSY